MAKIRQAEQQSLSMEPTELLPSDSRLMPLSRSRKVYPRLCLDISFKELAAALFSFLHRSDPEQHVREIQSFWKSDRQVLVTLSVRTAFDLLLESLNLPAGSEVLMSAVNIQGMFEVARRHKLAIVPVDICLETLAPDIQLLEQLISAKTKILIIAHLFGAIINLQPYADLCQKYKILLIEDCAQAFRGDKYCGHEGAGVSFFSFGPIKSCTALGGASTIIRDSLIAEKMKNIEQQYPKKSDFWFLKRVVKYLGLKIFSRPWLYGNLLAFLKILGKDLDATINSMTRGFSQQDILSQIRYRPPNRMLALLQRRLANCNNYWFERRQEEAQKFLSLLLPDIPYPGRQAENNSFWLVPILAAHPELLMAKLRENGFDATRGNTSLTFLGDRYYIDASPRPIPLNAEYLIEHILYLPISAYLSEKELVSLAHLVNKFYK